MMTFQIASGEILYGANEKTAIFVAFDGDLSKIEYKSAQGTSTHYDSEIKQYKHGGFFLKSPEIVIFGHPLGHDKYTLVVMTSMGFERFKVVSDDFFDIPIASLPKEKEPEKIPEPEIPQESDRERILHEYYESKRDSARSADNTPDVIIKYNGEVLKSYKLGSEFWLSGSAQNIKDYRAFLEGATISYEISRDGFVVREGSVVTPESGYAKFRIYEMDYPEFYPNWCYTLTVTTEWEGMTAIEEDKFKIKQSSLSKTWDDQLDWLKEDRWNYLPTEYRHEPRIIDYTDENCK